MTKISIETMKEENIYIEYYKRTSNIDRVNRLYKEGWVPFGVDDRNIFLSPPKDYSPL